MRLLAAAALALSAACRSEKAAPSQESTQVLHGVTMVESAAGRRKWELVAGEANLHETEERIDATAPVIRIEKDGQETTRLRGDRGEFYTSSRNVVLEGHVCAESFTEKATLYTDLLHFDSPANRIWTDHAVKVVTKDGTVDGVGFEAKPDLSEVTIKHQVGRKR